MKHIIYICLTAIMLSVCVSAECQKKDKKPKYSVSSKKAIALYEDAQNDYQFQKLQSCLLKLDQVIKMEPKFTEAYFMRSEVYRDLNDYKGQFDNISTAVGLDSTMFTTAYYLAGVALCNMERFTEALEWFDLYKKFSAGKRNQKNVDALIAKALFIKDMLEHPVPYNPRPMSKNLEIDYDQYWPSITLDEEEFVFTVLVPNDPVAFAQNPLLPHTSKNYNEDFYISHYVDGDWEEPKPMQNVNTTMNEGAQALSADGKWMFFTACGREDSKGSCDIYFSRRTANGWTTPVNVGAPVNTLYWESQPCFSADGQTLYFVSNRPGGKGGHDIWSAKVAGFRSNGTPIFGDLKNLGDSINTSGNESSPFIHPDDKTLYFSSNGWMGLGGDDIFISRRKDYNTAWSKPKNIGYPINTSTDNNGFVINAAGDKAFLSTTRVLSNGRKKIEILSIDLPEEIRPEAVSYIKGHVYNSKTMMPVGASLELINLEDGTCKVKMESDPTNGDFVVNLPAGKDYALFVSAAGYLFHSQNFALESTASTSERVSLDVPLSPIVVGEKATLRNIFFDTNSTELKEESNIELDRLVSLMKMNEHMKIEVGGHTDNVGSAEYNKRLSEGRAKTTVEYLISKGIAANRITYKGFGFSQPIADNKTEEGRQRNRRIEIKITANK